MKNQVKVSRIQADKKLTVPEKGTVRFLINMI